MSERLDILMPVAAELPFFVVDTTGPLSVVLQYPGPPNPPPFTLKNAEGGYIFTQGDNFIVMSAGVTMPLSFQLTRPAANPYESFFLKALGIISGHGYLFREFAAVSDGKFYSIMENYDTPLDVFIDLQNQDASLGTYIKDERFSLGLNIDSGVANPQVSMVGVPASLNGSTQYVIPYLKILHNFALASS